MAVLAQVFSFQSVTLAAAVEWLLAIKILPGYYSSSQSHLATAALVFAANYAFFAFFWLLLYPNLFSPLRRIPGPRSFISLVHRRFLETKRPDGDLFLDLVDQYPGQDLVSLSVTGRQLLVMKPRPLADLLVHKSYDFIKPTRISGFLRHVLGDGLIIVEGNQHKFLRKNTMPAFSFRHIKDLYPMMWGKAVLFTTALKREMADNPAPGGGGPEGAGVVELSSWASRVTLDIIGIAGLGRKLNMLEKSEDPLLSIYEQLLEPSREKLVFAMSSLAFGFPFISLFPWKMNDLFNHLSSSLHRICGEMIEEKRSAIQEKGDDHFDILSLLIKSGNFSDSDLTDQLLTFLAAGYANHDSRYGIREFEANSPRHETTSSALTWACYLLAKHPEMQKKLRDEVRDRLPVDSSLGQTVDLAGELEQLPFLNGVINETLRLYPTVPLTVRDATRDTRLADQPIPKGTTMVLSMWLMNRSPEVWGSDAAEFRPERWINDAGKPNQTGGASSNYEFLTFLHGPRSCIGQGFARAEMRCLMAATIGSFEWDLAMDDAKVLPRGVITIKPANGMYLNLRPLDE